VQIDASDSAACGRDTAVIMLDAGNPASYAGSGTSWTNVMGRSGADQHVASFPTAPGFEDGAIVFDGTTRCDVDISEIGFHYRGSWSVELLINPAAEQATWAGVFGDHDCVGFTGIVMQQRNDRTNQYYFGYGSHTADGDAWQRLGGADIPVDCHADDVHCDSPTMDLPAGPWRHGR
jgi:hypothetical protein